MNIWDDAGGSPGAIVYTESFVGQDVDPDADGSFTLEPTGGSALTGGTTYWMSIILVADFGVSGQWFWNTAADVNGAEYHWRNPAGFSQR